MVEKIKTKNKINTHISIKNKQKVLGFIWNKTFVDDKLF